MASEIRQPGKNPEPVFIDIDYQPGIAEIAAYPYRSTKPI
jgi:hypothetical protein